MQIDGPIAQPWIGLFHVVSTSLSMEHTQHAVCADDNNEIMTTVCTHYV